MSSFAYFKSIFLIDLIIKIDIYFINQTNHQYSLHFYVIIIFMSHADDFIEITRSETSTNSLNDINYENLEIMDLTYYDGSTNDIYYEYVNYDQLNSNNDIVTSNINKKTYLDKVHLEKANLGEGMPKLNLEKLNLILDLDETLIHTIETKNKKDIEKYIFCSNLLLHYVYNETHLITFYRDNLFDFLKTMSTKFNLYVYTNGIKSYADRIICMINCQMGYNVFCDYKCRKGPLPENKFITSFFGLNPQNTIIIDDHHEIWPDDSDNQIIIKQFMGPVIDDDSAVIDDDELSKLTILLTELHNKYIYDPNKLAHYIHLMKFKYINDL